MLGNFMKRCGVVSRLTKASEKRIANIIILLLGISVVATMDGKIFLTLQTLILFGVGFLAIRLDAVCRMSARIIEREGQKYNTRNYLLMRAMGANIGG